MSQKIKLSTGQEYYMDGYLMNALNSLVYNARNDWDFVIIITGDRMVRVGKSVLGFQAGAYLADKLGTPFGLDNIFFDHTNMVDAAQSMPMNSIIVYDEGREGLAAIKSMKGFQQDLMDYFAECGQLNHIFIIILPDFFSLKEEIAVGRSEFLLNVYRKETPVERDLYGDGRVPVVKFDRGFFECFPRKKKRMLYDIAKSTSKKNYQVLKPKFYGRFLNYYPIDEEQYRLKKREALARFKEKKDKEKIKYTKGDKVLANMIMVLHDKKKSQRDIANTISEDFDVLISQKYVEETIHKYEIIKSSREAYRGYQ